MQRVYIDRGNIRISKPGYDAQTTSPRNLLFYAGTRVGQVIYSGVISGSGGYPPNYGTSSYNQNANWTSNFVAYFAGVPSVCDVIFSPVWCSTTTLSAGYVWYDWTSWSGGALRCITAPLQGVSYGQIGYFTGSYDDIGLQVGRANLGTFTTAVGTNYISASYYVQYLPQIFPLYLRYYVIRKPFAA
jgi:hypothetical protein